MTCPIQNYLSVSGSSFQPRVILPPRGHLALSGDIFGCYHGGCCWHLVCRGPDTVRHPPAQRLVVSQKALSMLLQKLGGGIMEAF